MRVRNVRTRKNATNSENFVTNSENYVTNSEKEGIFKDFNSTVNPMKIRSNQSRSVFRVSRIRNRIRFISEVGYVSIRSKRTGTSEIPAPQRQILLHFNQECVSGLADFQNVSGLATSGVANFEYLRLAVSKKV
jgi:hypothetical protein